LRRLLDQGRTLLLATHDEEFAREFATRVLRMREGVV
jgi:ABC-type polar amino acid transport system ATPase subunit